MRSKIEMQYRASNCSLRSSLVLGALAKGGNVVCKIVAKTVILGTFDGSGHNVAIFVDWHGNIAI